MALSSAAPRRFNGTLPGNLVEISQCVRRVSFCLTMACALMAWSSFNYAQDDADTTVTRSANANNKSDVHRRHFRSSEIAQLSPTEAERIYQIIREALGKGYVSLGVENPSGYQSLTRHNTAPYTSATHGNHYLNNYTNDVAEDYGKFEKAGVLPEGSVIYKDSFTVTETRQSFSGGVSRQISLGPLFIMRKMNKGFNPLTGNWQYMEIRPDGRLLGMTNGEGSENVEYCIACHLAREKHDHLYFVPEEYRN